MIKKTLFLFLPLLACAPQIDKRGFEDIKEAKILIHTKTDNWTTVKNKLGNPNATSLDSKSHWYYVSKTEETKAFYAPKIIEQYLLKISFDSKSGQVILVELKTGEIGKKINLINETTPTTGTRESYLKDIFGNIGKFSQK